MLVSSRNVIYTHTLHFKDKDMFAIHTYSTDTIPITVLGKQLGWVSHPGCKLHATTAKFFGQARADFEERKQKCSD